MESFPLLKTEYESSKQIFNSYYSESKIHHESNNTLILLWSTFRNLSCFLCNFRFGKPRRFPNKYTFILKLEFSELPFPNRHISAKFWTTDRHFKKNQTEIQTFFSGKWLFTFFSIETNKNEIYYSFIK